MNLPKSKLKEDFLNWLDKQELAPYKQMFDDIPEFVQVSYVKKYLREQECIDIEILTVKNNLAYCYKAWSEGKLIANGAESTYELANLFSIMAVFADIILSDEKN